jgi:hypothetical protein
MDSDQTPGSGYWRYLINPDKSATPQLEQLCLGLAKVIVSGRFTLRAYVMSLTQRTGDTRAW